MPCGSTASRALTTAGEASSAGKIFRPCAPCASAVNASVGVSTPGRLMRPSLTDSSITAGLQLGEMTSWPPRSVHIAYLLRRQHRACTHQHIGIGGSHGGNAAKRIGRVRQHLRGKVCAVQRSADSTASAGCRPRRMAVAPAVPEKRVSRFMMGYLSDIGRWPGGRPRWLHRQRPRPRSQHGAMPVCSAARARKNRSAQRVPAAGCMVAISWPISRPDR